MKNEIKMIKEYQDYRLNAKGDDPKTVEKKLRSIHIFKKYMNKPLHSFNKEDAKNFKRYLLIERKLSIRTTYSYLHYLEQFYFWLSGEKGFRSRIDRNHIEFFSLNRSEKNIVNSGSPKFLPKPEYILKLHESIPQNTKIGKRDRALLALIYLAGLRSETAISLRKGSIDNKYFVYQDPEKGVKTKFSKKNTALIFDYYPKLKKSIQEWIDTLNELGFSETDPLFPKFAALAGTDQKFLFPELNEPSKEFLANPNTLNQIIRKRCEAAGLEYKHPHLFRHAFFDHGEEYCTNGKQFKALSQSGGHSHIATTIKSYGELSDEELKEQLLLINENIRNSREPNPKGEELIKILDEFKEKLMSPKRGKRF